MRNLKNKCNCWIFILLSIFCLSCVSCGDDDDNDGEKGSYPFVGKDYVYEWTLQNTSQKFQYVIHFTSDSTLTFRARRASTGADTNGYKTGSYYINGSTIYFQIGSLYTKIRGQSVDLLKARFKNESMTTLEVLRTLEFMSGNSRIDWVDFKLDE